MRAAIFRNGQIVVDTIADPAPPKARCLVKTLCCGICGTDLHAAKYPPGSSSNVASRAGGRWPMDPTRDVVFGHEFCCEVVDRGPGTDKRLKSGHAGLLDADDHRRQNRAGHRLFQRGRRRLRTVHAVG